MGPLHHQREDHMEVYIETSRLNQLAEAIAAIEPCPGSGKIEAYQVKMLLGERGNIWPASILPDALTENT